MNGVFAPSPTALRLAPHGAQLSPQALDAADVAGLLRVLADQPAGRAGVRLFGIEGLDRFLTRDGPVGRLADSVMAGRPWPVRALLFDKTASANWSLAWHQDRVVAVRERRDAPGFGPWSRKTGVLHVAPPADLLARMTTLRVHLDPVPSTNAPLLIAPGSHRLGHIAEGDVSGVVSACVVAACIAAVGDVWMYSTPILHASARAERPVRRRVLQVDYAAEPLPGGLQWLGV